MRLPPLYALRAFEVAARFGSFTQAAKSLSITQSAVSRHVKTLEEHLGCTLFERKGPRLALTAAGLLLAQELERGFATIEHACTAIFCQKGVLRLKAPSTLTMRWLLHALEEFQGKEQGQRVQLTSAWMDVDFVDFRTEPFDCAVLLSRGDFPAEWNSIKLFDEWLVPVCSPELLGKPAWPLDKLAANQLIHPSRDCRDWQRWLERQGLQDAVAWREGKRFDTLELGISAAAQGFGVSIGDLALVEKELRKGTLTIPFKTAVRSGDSYFLVWPQNGAKHKMLTAMQAFLLEHLPIMQRRDLRFLG